MQFLELLRYLPIMLHLLLHVKYSFQGNVKQNKTYSPYFLPQLFVVLDNSKSLVYIRVSCPVSPFAFS